MSGEPVATTRVRTENEMKTIEDIPDEILADRIFRPLRMEHQWAASQVCSAWRLLVPFADLNGCLQVRSLPLKRLVRKYYDGEGKRQKCLDAKFLSAVLKNLLSRDQVGKKLKTLSFEPFTLDFQISNRLINVIAKFCPHLTGLDLSGVLRPPGVPSVVNFGKLAELGQLKSFAIQRFRPDIPDFSLISSERDLHRLLSSWKLQNLRLLGDLHQYNYYANFVPVDYVRGPVPTDADLAHIAQSCPELTELQLDDCYKLTDFSPLGLLKKLTKLTLNSCGTDVHLGQLCPELKDLKVKFNIQRSPRQLLGRMAKLTRLSVRGCLDLSDICRFSTEVTHLQLSNCRLVDGFDYLPLGWLFKLIDVRLEDNGPLPTDQFDQIAGRWRNLTRLVVNNCGGSLEWAAKIPQLKEIKFSSDNGYFGIFPTWIQQFSQLEYAYVESLTAHVLLRFAELPKLRRFEVFQIDYCSLLALESARRTLKVSSPPLVIEVIQYADSFSAYPHLPQLLESLQSVGVTLKDSLSLTN